MSFIVYLTLSADSVCGHVHLLCFVLSLVLRLCSYLACTCFITFSQNINSVVSGYPLLCHTLYGVSKTSVVLRVMVSIALFLT
jgi:hypothetical protein